jgi:predicted PurR-regulated permease PerM
MRVVAPEAEEFRRAGPGEANSLPEPASVTAPVSAGRLRADLRTVCLVVLTMLAAVVFCRSASSFLIPVVLAILLSYILEPAIAFLERRGVSRVTGTVCLAVLLFALIAASVGNLLESSMRIVNTVPAAAGRVREALASSRADGDTPLGRLVHAAAEVKKTADAAAGTVPTAVTPVSVAEPLLGWSDYLHWGDLLLGFFGRAATIVFLALFLLGSGDLYRRKLIRVVGDSFASKKATLRILSNINRQIGKFLQVQLAVIAMVFVVTLPLLMWLGVEQPYFWSLVSGVFSTVPFFGPLMWSVGLGLVAAVELGSMTQGVWVFAISGAFATFKGFVLVPWLTGKAMRMNQVAILTGLVFWIWVWGLPGMLLALPMMAVIKAVCDHVAALRPVGEMLSE